MEPAIDQAPRGAARGAGGVGVNLVLQGFGWIFDSKHWTTSLRGTGVLDALTQHLILTGVSLVVVILIAVPLGLYIGHTGKGRSVAIVTSNVARALPTLGLLALLIVPLTGVIIGRSGYLPDVIVFVILGIPPLLAGVYSGLESVDRLTIDAARATGMTELQVLLKVEIPLGIQLIIGGLRSTSLQIIATVTIASLYGAVTLGSFILTGLAANDYVEMTAGAILVAALALIVDGLFAIVQRFAVPRGVSRGSTGRRNTTARDRKRSVALTRTPIKEGN
jgi:osmoprotectant transport system permease protein